MTNDSKPVQCLLISSNGEHPYWHQILDPERVAILDTILQVITCTEEDFKLLSNYIKKKNQKVGVNLYELVRILPEKSLDSSPSFEFLLAEARVEQEEDERRKRERQAKLAATKKKKGKLEFQAKAEKLKALAEELGAKVSIPNDTPQNSNVDPNFAREIVKEEERKLAKKEVKFKDLVNGSW